MIGLAWASAAHHRRNFRATGIVVFLGAGLVAAMATILNTGLAPDAQPDDRAFLTQFPVIMGGWLLAIVVFAVVSTVSVALDSRAAEIAGLRLIGATPAQVRRLVAVETAAIAVVAVIPGVGLGYLIGWGLVHRVREVGLVTSPYAPGIALPLAAGAALVVVSMVGGHLGARGAARRSPVGGTEPECGRKRTHRPRILSAVVVLLLGCGSALGTFGMSADSVMATATAGPGVVLVTVGLALLARELLMLVTGIWRRLPVSRSAAGRLARINVRSNPGRMRPVVTFLTLFVGVCAGTLAMQSIENTASARRASGPDESIGAVMASINYLVVGLMAVFMAVALATNVTSAVHARRKELHTVALIGATPNQVHGTVARETFAAVLASAIAGTVGSVLAVIPFAIVKVGDPVAALPPLTYLVTIGAGTALALGVTARAVSQTRR